MNSLQEFSSELEMLFKCLFFVVALFQFVEVWPVETRMRDVCNFHGTDDLTSVYIVQTGGVFILFHHFCTLYKYVLIFIFMSTCFCVNESEKEFNEREQDMCMLPNQLHTSLSAIYGKLRHFKKELCVKKGIICIAAFTRMITSKTTVSSELILVWYRFSNHLS